MQNIRHLYGCLVPAHLSWSVCVKSDVKLAGLLLRVTPLVFGKLSPSIVKVTYGFAKNVRRVLQSSGPRGLAIWLKAHSVVLQHVAGGQKAKSPWALGAHVSRTRRGVPRLINPQHRDLILSGNVEIIRFWLTLFGLYRVVEFKGALKLKTITDPGVDISVFRKDWIEWIPSFYDRVGRHTKSRWEGCVNKLTPWSIPFIKKSAPNSRGLPAVAALALDLLMWYEDTEMYEALQRWLKLVDGLDLLWAVKPLIVLVQTGQAAFKRMRAEAKVLERKPSKLDLVEVGQSPQPHYESRVGKASGLNFGKLGFKHEPGKIRVFAMVNIITQALMQPLHQWIFDRLREIVTDGTFDQTAPVERMISRFVDKRRQFVASYDLSAATDRLPLSLQMDLLEPLLGKELTQLWAKFLVGRPYKLPKIAKSYNVGVSSVSYSVGQPMGALSSWAMLALTHHALVQLAASRAISCYGWFMEYAVLGDDVVIANEAVAAEYLRVMATIGVEVGLAKSMVSRTGSLEFAKRTWIQGREVTPVSLAELLVGLTNLGALEQLMRKSQRFVEIRLASVARFAGFGYKNLARLPVAFGLNSRFARLLAYVCRPGGLFPMPVEAWLSAVGPGREDGATDVRYWAVAQSLWSRIVKMLIDRNVRVERMVHRAANFKYAEATVLQTRRVTAPNGKVTVTRSRVPAFGPIITVQTGLATPSGFAAWSLFFTDWVAYPFTQKVRKTFSRIEDILRVLDPGIQPQWSRLDELWTQIFEAEDGQSALPTSIDYFHRETDVVVPSTRLVTLWRKMRAVVNRESLTSVNISTARVQSREARRRRAGK